MLAVLVGKAPEEGGAGHAPGDVRDPILAIVFQTCATSRTQFINDEEANSSAIHRWRTGGLETCNQEEAA